MRRFILALLAVPCLFATAHADGMTKDIEGYLRAQGTTVASAAEARPVRPTYSPPRLTAPEPQMVAQAPAPPTAPKAPSTPPAPPPPAAKGPYFRLLDISHPQPLLGAFIDPAEIGGSETGGMLPVFTHSPRDGCLLPKLVCEDWSPLALGGSGNAGRFKLAVSAVFNLLPLMQGAGLYALDYFERKAPGLRQALTPTTPGASFDARISIAPSFVYDPFYSAEGGKRGHGYFRIFIGPQLLF